MSAKPIAIASDHAGFELKRSLAEELSQIGYDVLDLGTDGPDSVDYPEFGQGIRPRGLVSGFA